MRFRRSIPSWGLVALLPAAVAAQAPAPALQPYLDPSLPIERRVEDLLGRMTLEEKFWQLYMSPGSLDDPAHDYSAGAFGLQIGVAPESDPAAGAAALARAHAERVDSIQRWFVEETRLGIPILPFDEALHGLMREGATVFPQAIGLAATWDTALVAEVSRAAAAEARSRGVRQVLSPVVNVADDVRWGRVEETFGEDPLLVSEMGRVFVTAFEQAGIVTTPKHFVANVGAGGRDSYPVEAGERYLSEVHFPPFRVALGEAGAGSLMTAYNSVDGRPATQNPWLLTDVLRERWNWPGFVISDAAATGGAVVLHHTEPNTPVAAAHAWGAGLDVVFQSTWPQHRPYLEAVTSGLVDEAVIDSAVARVLRAKFGLGLFESPWADPDEAARLVSAAGHRDLARRAAAASMVLLENRGERLPLVSDPGVVAVLGVDAAEPRMGGYSAPPSDPVSLVDGLRERLGPERVRYAPGPGRTSSALDVVPADAFTNGEAGATGLEGRYWDNIEWAGEPTVERIDERLAFQWTLNSPGRGIPYDWYSARWTGRLTAPAGGVTRLGLRGNDGYRLWLDGGLLIDNLPKRSVGERVVDVDLAAGSVHEIRVDYVESAGNARLALVWDGGPVEGSGARVREAADLAASSDLAVVVAGLEEGEFRDRAFLSLPGRQEAMIRAVAATGTPTVVVVVGGSAVTVSNWVDEVDAVLLAWYPGVEGGRAVADVLFGDRDPGGRLPITFPVSEGQLPLVYNHKPTGRGDDYVDLTGHAAYPFGFGLAYAPFEYSDLEITPDRARPDEPITVRATVRNVGDRPAEEVVQLYLRDVLASVTRPVTELAGFRKVRLAPGESARVSFTLDRRAFEMLDADLRRVVEPGTFRVTVGRSARDLRLRGHLDIVGGPP